VPKYVRDARTGGLAQVQARLLVAYVNSESVRSVNWNKALQLYDGIPDSFDNFITVTLSVLPAPTDVNYTYTY